MTDVSLTCVQDAAIARGSSKVYLPGTTAAATVIITAVIIAMAIGLTRSAPKPLKCIGCISECMLGGVAHRVLNLQGSGNSRALVQGTGLEGGRLRGHALQPARSLRGAGSYRQHPEAHHVKDQYRFLHDCLKQWRACNEPQAALWAQAQGQR